MEIEPCCRDMKHHSKDNPSANYHIRYKKIGNFKDLNGVYICSDSDTELVFKIEYCPFCGKKIRIKE